LIRNLISGLSHLDFTLVGIYEELNITITGGFTHMTGNNSNNKFNFLTSEITFPEMLEECQKVHAVGISSQDSEKLIHWNIQSEQNWKDLRKITKGEIRLLFIYSDSKILSDSIF